VSSCDASNNCNTSTQYNFTTSAVGDGGNGGNGGGTDGGIPSPTSPSKTHSWSKITPGVVTIMKDFDSGFGIKQIQIEVNNEAQNVKITVTKYDNKPANVSIEKSGKVYKYLQIETENLEDKLNRSIITIQVEKNWTSENNVERDDMAMFKFNESYEVWNELETVYTEENEIYYYYDVELDSFSYFAIAADVVEEPEEIEEEKSKLWLWVVVALVIMVITIIITIIILIIRYRKMHYLGSDYKTTKNIPQKPL
jgi:PGF-pre-PGF domain-containing protein